MTAIGIDISEMDGTVNWPVAASRKIAFATIRATYRANGTDGKHFEHMQAAKAVGVKRIPYHWFAPRIEAISQARNFVQNSVAGEYAHMVDLEDTRTVKAYLGIASQLQIFLAEVERLTTRRPIVYASPDYILLYLTKSTWLGDYPLIIAHYDAAAPRVPLPWCPTNWLAWQYTRKADAHYYGLPECVEAALYVWNGEMNREDDYHEVERFATGV